MAYIGKRPVDTFPANNAVTSTIIAENAVNTSEIATNAVTTLLIADNAVTGVKIAENSITTRELAANIIATGNIADNAIDGTKIAQNSILTRHIDDGQVTTDQLGADAVTAAKLADDAVVTANIVDANVTTAKIATNAVTSAKIAQNSILTKHIDDAQVGSDQLTTDAVTTVKITDANVTAAKLASDSVTTAKITDANVTTVKIADSNITTAKIADDAVTLAKMAALTRGSIIVGDSSGNPSALALGSNGQILKSDGTDLVFAADNELTTEEVQDIAGGMFSSNTETGITATYQDADGTVDLVISDSDFALTGDVTGTATQTAKGNVSIATTIAANSVALGTDTTGNYVGTLTAGTGLSSTGATSGEGIAHSVSLDNTAVTAGSYGSSSAIPVITIDAQGRITNASTAATSSTLTIAADSGSNDTVTVGTDTLTFEGTANEVNTTVSDNKITIGLPDNVTIAGNLTVSGTTTTVSSTTINVADPLISLATTNNAADAVDIGIYGLYDTSGSQDLYSGFFRDASDSGKWKLFKDSQAEPTTTVNTGATGYAVGTLVANVEGDITGDVTGNADTATTLATARTIGGVSFNGSANIDLPGVNTTGNQNTTGSAATLTTARAIALSGDVTGTANFDGSAGISITSSLAANTVDSAELVDGSIDTSHIADAQVTTAKLAADAVTGAKIADDAIDSEHYTDGSIDTAHIADDQVTLAKMAGITRGSIIVGDSLGNPSALALGTNGQVLKSDGTDLVFAADSGLSTEEVQDIVGGMVTGNTETGIAVTYEDGDGTLDFIIGSGSIASSMLAADSVTQAKIADDAVGADQLAANSVVSASIVNGSIVSADIADNTIATSNIADNAVDATKIASNSILTRHIDDNQITGDQIADDIVLSGTGAIRMPDGTTAQRPGSPAAGMFRYNTTTGKFEGYTSAWGDIGGGGAGSFSTDTMTGDGSDTTLTLSVAPESEDDVILFIDGVFQAHDTYSVSGTTLTFATAPASGRVVTAYTVKNAVSGSNLTHDSFSGDGSDTTFTLSITPVHENNTQVYIDGVYQHKDTYSVSGTTLTFSSAPPNGTSIEAMTMNQTEVNVPVDDTITTAKIADNAITAAKIASGTVVASDIADGTITTAKLADNSVTAAKIAAGVLTDQVAGISSAADATAITIDSSERVGIGNTSPATKFDVITGSTGGFKLDDEATSGGVKITTYQGSTNSNVRNINFDVQNFIVSTGAPTGTSVSEALRVDNSGNVGIGTTSPDSLLHVDGSDVVGRFNSSSGAVKLRFQEGGTARAFVGTLNGSNGFAIFGSDGTTERVRVDSNGKVGIGTSSPDNPLHVYHATTNGVAHFESGDSGVNISLSDSATTAVNYNTIGAVGNELTFASNAAERMRIDSSGRVGIGTSSPAGALDVVSTGYGSWPFYVRRSANGAQLAGIYESSSGDGGHGMFYLMDGGGTTDVKLSTNGVSWINGGNVGIGTSSPSRLLDIENSAAAGSTLVSLVSATDGNVQLLMGDTASDTQGKVLYNNDGDYMSLHTNGAERIRIDSTGDIFFGSQSLTDNGGASISPEEDDGAPVLRFRRAHTTNTSDVIRFINAGSTVGFISHTNSSTAYNTSSDYRLKENVDYTWDATTRLKQLKPARFNWIADDTNTLIDGFLAHEVSSIVPEAVSGEKDGDEMQGIDHSKLVPLLVKTIQELEARITALES